MKFKGIILSCSLIALFQLTYGGKQRPTKISWKDLSSLDIKTGKISKKLETLIENKISISGFAIPLEQGKAPNTVKELALVPDLMLCYHVPSPPPNQVIEAFLDKEASMNLLGLGVKLTGIIRVVELTGRSYKYGYRFYVTNIKTDKSYTGNFVEAPNTAH